MNTATRLTIEAREAADRLRERESYIPSALDLTLWLDRKEILNLLGWPASQLHSAIVEGEFPAPVKLTRLREGWASHEYQNWCNMKVREWTDSQEVSHA